MPKRPPCIDDVSSTSSARPARLSLRSREASAVVIVLLAVVAWYAVGRLRATEFTAPAKLLVQPELLQRFRAAVEESSAAGAAEPRRYLVFRATKFSGGLGDRLLGLVSTIALAIVTKRRLLIDWVHPAELSTALVCIVHDCSSSAVQAPGALLVSLIDSREKLKEAFELDDLVERWAGVDVLTISQNQNTCEPASAAWELR